LRLLRNSSVPLVLQIGVRALNMIFAIVLYRHFSANQSPIADYEFAAFITTLLLVTVAEWGLNVYMTREVARDESVIERAMGTLLVLRLVLAALVLLLAVLLIPTFNYLQTIGLITNRFEWRSAATLIILGSTVLPGTFSTVVGALFVATERPIVPAIENLLTNIVSVALRILALVFGFGILGVACGSLVAACWSATIYAMLLKRIWGWPRLQFDQQLARMMLSAGLPLMLNGVLLAIYFRFDTFIIRAYRPADEFAAYAAAYKYINLMLFLPPVVINAVFPLFARQAIADHAALRRAYRYLARLLLLLVLPLATAGSFISPWLIAALGGTAYVPLGAPALAILIWYLPLSCITNVIQYVLIALDRARLVTLAFTGAAVFNLSFNLSFVPAYGINAAAIATVLSEVVLVLLLRRALRQQLDSAPLWRSFWRLLVATGMMAIGMLVAGQIDIIIGLVVGFVFFGGSLWMLGVIQAEDRRLAQRVLRQVGLQKA
jgi:O-antigen/teichoic acid export membrane protein